MYVIESERLKKRPEVRVGDRIYAVDDRLSTFERINARIKEGCEGEEFATIIGEALGEENFREIKEMDLPYGVMYELVIIVLAAIQDLTVEEARRRFRGGGRQ